MKILLQHYTLGLQQITDLAGEYNGRVLCANTGEDDASVDLGFDEEPTASANAKAFRHALDTCFRRRSEPDLQ